MATTIASELSPRGTETQAGGIVEPVTLLLSTARQRPGGKFSFCLLRLLRTVTTVTVTYEI